jgi:hypothetical protein
MIHIPRPAYPKCQTETILSRISFDVSGFDFRTFECPACEYVHKAPVALIDPMKSEETRGWLQGQLQAPN